VFGDNLPLKFTIYPAKGLPS